MRLISVFVLSLLASCTLKETPPPVEYNGPLSEMQDVDMLYSEKDRVKVKMLAHRILQYKSGDKEFPDGIYLEFFNEKGIMTSTLKANQAYYFKEEDQWRGRGNVIVKNIAKQQQLNTEELFWKESKHKIFTDKFVTIRLENEVIYGTGLDAAQDMSTYTIHKPEGIFEIKD